MRQGRDDTAAVQLGAAMALHRDGRLADAEAAYRAILGRWPEQADALHLAGVAAHQQGRSADGVALVRRALIVRPDMAAAWDNLGAILTDLGDRAGTAEAHATAATRHPPGPDRARARTRQGRALFLLDRLEAAESAFRAALADDPGQTEARTRLAELLVLTGRTAAAEAILAAARVPASDRAGVAMLEHAWGYLHQFQGRFAEAEAAFDRALAADPGAANGRWNRSLLRLARGDLPGGWQDYAARFAARAVNPDRRFRLPRWDGSPLAGGRLLIWREQGLGDELLFASLYAEAIGKASRGNAGEVRIEADRRLVGLFARSLPMAEVRAEDLAPTADHADLAAEIPAGGLPGLLRPTLDGFAQPGAGAYLRPDPRRVSGWAQRLAELPPGLRVGFSWTSGLLSLERKDSYLPLAAWAPLAGVAGVTLVNLVWHDLRQDLAAAAMFAGRLHGWPGLDLRDDLEELAALVANLDLVICAPTAVGELAAALGVPVWRVQGPGDWSTLGTSVRPWFPTMRVFQTAPGQALQAMPARVAERLRQLADVAVPVSPAAQPPASQPAAASAGASAAAPDPDSLHREGLRRWQAGAAEQALDLLRQAAALAPRDAELLNNLGSMEQALGRFEQAAGWFRKALAAKPSLVPAISNLGVALQELGRLQDAEACHRRAVAVAPDRAESWTNLGSLLAERGRPAEAAGAHGKALALDPGFALAHSNLGTALLALGRRYEAEAAFARALAVDPAQPIARFNMALFQLARGEQADGWAGYEHRFQAKRGQPARRFAIPRWRGEDLRAKRLLVWREQGVGDELMFAALYPQLATRCGHLTVECDPRLTGLFARSLPAGNVTVRPPTRDPRDADLEVPAGSLARILAPDLRGFAPCAPGWLRPDPARADAMAAWLEGLGPGLRVGFCWRSGLRAATREGFYSRLEDWAALFRLPGIVWVVLQYDAARPDTLDELDKAAAPLGVTLHIAPGLDLMDDLEGVAALTAGLDLVLTAATAVGELSASLGIPTWRLGGDDEWTMLGTGVRPWFPAQRVFPMTGRGPAETLGRMARELTRLLPVADLSPTSPEGSLEQALALHRAGHLPAAEAAYRALLAANPDDPDTLHLLGALLLQTGRAVDAEPLVARAVARDPAFAQAHNTLGGIRRARGQTEAALADFRRAVALDPAYAEAWTNLGAALAELHLFADALEAHDRALAGRPGYPLARLNRGIALSQCGRAGEAVALLRGLAADLPGDPLVLTNLGLALEAAGDIAGAVAHHERALAAAPDTAAALNNLAMAHVAGHRPAEARRLLDRAAQLHPDFAPARYNRALLALGDGALALGWAEHEHRFAALQAKPDRRLRIPRWDGGELAGKRLLIWREQGLGDELMFATLYAEMAARAGHLVVECDRRLVGLFQRAFPQATVRPESVDPDDADAAVPAGSLPSLLRGTMAQFAAGPFLASRPDLAERWRDRLAALPAGLKVGLCWRSQVCTGDRANAYTRLEDWVPLLTLPGVVPVSLQYDGAEAEIAAVEAAAGVALQHWPDTDLRDDLETAAALIAGLDLVVTAPTAVGELAGALGVPVWRVGGTPDWSRLGTAVRPWFPTMRVIDPAPGQPLSAAPAAVCRLLERLRRDAAPSIDALLATAAALHREGKAATAEPLYRRILAQQPDHPVALHLLGLVHSQRGDPEAAIPLMRRALAAAPGYRAARVNLGNALLQAGRPAEAETEFRRALVEAPGAPDILTNLGNALRALGRREDAAAFHRDALAADPGFALAAANLGTVLLELDRPDAAEAALRQARDLGDGRPETLTAHGEALRGLGRADDGMALHRQALALAPDLPDAHNNLGRCLEALGRKADARVSYRRALATDPTLASARMNLALLDLEAGNLSAGWAGYASRFAADVKHGMRRIDLPTWQGEDLTGKRLLVWREQGLGDELLFATLYPALLRRCGHLVVECDPRLVGLLRRALPCATVRPPGGNPRDADLAVAAGDLPRVLLPTLASADPPSPLLSARPDLAALWRDRLAALGPGLKVGLCWRSRTQTLERRRTYTQLAQWGPLFALAGVQVVNLQYGDPAAEIASVRRDLGWPLASWPDLDMTDDLEGVAALMAGLDLVISAPTAVGELAGALGLPVWRLAPPDWTMLGTGVRPWFPTMRVVPLTGGADAAVAGLVRALERLSP